MPLPSPSQHWLPPGTSHPSSLTKHRRIRPKTVLGLACVFAMCNNNTPIRTSNALAFPIFTVSPSTGTRISGTAPYWTLRTARGGDRSCQCKQAERHSRLNPQGWDTATSPIPRLVWCRIVRWKKPSLRSWLPVRNCPTHINTSQQPAAVHRCRAGGLPPRLSRATGFDSDETVMSARDPMQRGLSDGQVKLMAPRIGLSLKR